MRSLPLVAGIAVAIFFATFAILTRSDAEFSPPGSGDRIRSVGKTSSLPATQRAAFVVDDDFMAITKPAASDWLANHKEPGQTFDEFLWARRNRPDKIRNTIYLVPIGEFDGDEGYPSLETMTAYTSAFFAMKVKRLPVLDVAKLGLTSRLNAGKTQLLTGDILKSLAKAVPKDAYCVLAVTMTDLYPDPTWNYVFGMASLRERVGVFSFARHDPAFFGRARGEKWQAAMLERNCKVLAHEIGHMFGIRHCIYFECLMNGSNHLAESDAKPLHLCPSCLRKLHTSIGFDIVERYRNLHKFLVPNELDEESQWLAKRLRKLDIKCF